LTAKFAVRINPPVGVELVSQEFGKCSYPIKPSSVDAQWIQQAALLLKHESTAYRLRIIQYYSGLPKSGDLHGQQQHIAVFDIAEGD